MTKHTPTYVVKRSSKRTTIVFQQNYSIATYIYRHAKSQYSISGKGIVYPTLRDAIYAAIH